MASHGEEGLSTNCAEGEGDDKASDMRHERKLEAGGDGRTQASAPLAAAQGCPDPASPGGQRAQEVQPTRGSSREHFR